jgi:hypothetical protein
MLVAAKLPQGTVTIWHNPQKQKQLAANESQELGTRSGLVVSLDLGIHWPEA